MGGWEIVIILAVLLLLFGAKKLPDMARSVGQSARVFKGEMKGLKDDESGPKTAEKPAEQPAEPSSQQTPPSSPGELSPGTTLNQPSQAAQQAQRNDAT